MAKLHFYYSAMNAGKSTALLQASYNYQERGMQTIIFTPEIDTRSGRGIITSRIGLKANALSFDNTSDLYEITFAEKNNFRPKLSCVLIDEAQFLNKRQVFQLGQITDLLKIPVLAYGLRTDFQAEPFEGSKYLLALADQLIEIKTICFCGKKATMNIRMAKDGKVLREGTQIEIGGNERYIAVCRHHFATLQNVPDDVLNEVAITDIAKIEN